ncbi:MAG: non-heme iron oxygenase ferredoxin subunit [Granulosicoccus sp.]
MKNSSKSTRLLPLDELVVGKTRRVEHLDHAILLCRVEDSVYAVNDLCTHEDISLSLGVLCEHRLRCPLHGSEFDVRTGKVLDEPADTDLPTYPVAIIDGWVCLQHTPTESKDSAA